MQGFRLVVEDDHAIQSIVEESLTEAGFELSIASSGEEAVTLLQSGKGKYRALVTDINLLGKLDGWEVAKHVREIDPDSAVSVFSESDAGCAVAVPLALAR
jgi:DNA-binding response OmpR family regulator